MSACTMEGFYRRSQSGASDRREQQKGTMTTTRRFVFAILVLVLLTLGAHPAAAQTAAPEGVIVRTNLGLLGLQTVCLLNGCTVQGNLDDSPLEPPVGYEPVASRPRDLQRHLDRPEYGIRRARRLSFPIRQVLLGMLVASSSNLYLHLGKSAEPSVIVTRTRGQSASSGRLGPTQTLEGTSAHTRIGRSKSFGGIARTQTLAFPSWPRQPSNSRKPCGMPQPPSQYGQFPCCNERRFSYLDFRATKLGIAR